MFAVAGADGATQHPRMRRRCGGGNRRNGASPSGGGKDRRGTSATLRTGGPRTARRCGVKASGRRCPGRDLLREGPEGEGGGEGSAFLERRPRATDQGDGSAGRRVRRVSGRDGCGGDGPREPAAVFGRLRVTGQGLAANRERSSDRSRGAGDVGCRSQREILGSNGGEGSQSRRGRGQRQEGCGYREVLRLRLEGKALKGETP